MHNWVVPRERLGNPRGLDRNDLALVACCILVRQEKLTLSFTIVVERPVNLNPTEASDLNPKSPLTRYVDVLQIRDNSVGPRRQA
jgi:hypothetical protein